MMCLARNGLARHSLNPQHGLLEVVSEQDLILEGGVGASEGGSLGVKDNGVHDGRVRLLGFIEQFLNTDRVTRRQSIPQRGDKRENHDLSVRFETLNHCGPA
jgi:hypothetical protein